MRTRANFGTALRWLITAAIVASVGLPSAAQTPEHRALWAFAWGPGFKNANEVSALVERARSSNCNVIVAQMRKSGDAYYFPTRPNRDVRPADIAPDYDPLLELCTQAHALDIHVYAWVVAERIASAVPTNPDHLMNRHPDWLTKTITGGTYFPEEGYYADPGHPGAAEWNFNVAMDLVRHYPIDGLIFDYIRYPGIDSGYNAVALQRFQDRYSPNPSVPYYTDPLWSAWRREQVTNFVRKVYANALEVRPDVVIGASTFANRSDAYNAKFQDWRSWMIGGMLDCNCPMAYTTSNSTFIGWVGDAVANGGARHTYVLQGAYRNTITNTMTQLGQARSNGAKGVAPYRYCYTHSGDTDYYADNEPSFYSALTSQVFTAPVSRPSMPWKTSPTVGHVKGEIIDALQGAGVDAAWISVIPAGGGAGYGTYSDGTGFYAYLNLAPGDYDVTVTKSTFSQTKPVTITAGTISTVDFLASGSEAASIASAKQLPDGVGVALPPMMVTAGNNQLHNRFYIEDENRAAGIVVELPADTDVLVHPGDVVKVCGPIGVAPNGERRITSPIVHTLDTDVGHVRPIEIRGRDLAGISPNVLQAGADMSKIGLLVETVGRVTSVDAAEKIFYVDDGSAIDDGSGHGGLRVRYSGLATGNLVTPPETNTHVRLRGISSVEDIGGSLHCTLLLREQNDIHVDPGSLLHAPADAILPGWNLLTVPATPFDASPSGVFGAIPIDGRIQQWDVRSQGLLIYDSWSPEKFGAIMRGNGYWLQSDEGHPLSVTGYAAGADFLVALPKAGWAIIGSPFVTERAWGDTLVSNGLDVEPLSVAKSRNWMNSVGFWWDNQNQGLADLGLPEDFINSNTLEPWQGYWIQSYVDGLSLIFRCTDAP